MSGKIHVCTRARVPLRLLANMTTPYMFHDTNRPCAINARVRVMQAEGKLERIACKLAYDNGDVSR